MREKIKRYAEEIAKIIEDCEAMQDSYESEYTKKQAMLQAYEDIVELVGVIE